MNSLFIRCRALRSESDDTTAVMEYLCDAKRHNISDDKTSNHTRTQTHTLSVSLKRTISTTPVHCEVFIGLFKLFMTPFF